MSSFAEWVVKAIQEVTPAEAAESPKTAAAMTGLQALVATMRGRTAALAADALLPLSTLLTASAMSNSSSTVQLLYQTIFSLWSLSYSPEAAMEMASSKVGLIAKLVEIVKTASKEKVIRVALSTLRNLLGTGSASNDMVVFGVMPVLEAMQARKFADEDIPDDVELLYTTLQTNLLGLTSWDVYKTELESSKLEWSPSHKSENFWKDNYKAFEAHDMAAVKALVGCLQSDDPQVLAIACNDIAEFIKFHPEGRRLMTQAGAKPLAMQVLKHPDAAVQKYALTCVQRLMVINWEYLNRG
jgi:V-type H+-transporting ATPase subunit H